jgi:hypothetical protein
MQKIANVYKQCFSLHYSHEGPGSPGLPRLPVGSSLDIMSHFPLITRVWRRNTTLVSHLLYHSHAQCMTTLCIWYHKEMLAIRDSKIEPNLKTVVHWFYRKPKKPIGFWYTIQFSKFGKRKLKASEFSSLSIGFSGFRYAFASEIREK